MVLYERRTIPTLRQDSERDDTCDCGHKIGSHESLTLDERSLEMPCRYCECRRCECPMADEKRELWPLWQKGRHAATI